MIDFCILGSGVAGSTVANLLSKKYTLEVFDKARGPGGRTSNKKLKLNLSFDHGLQYFSPKTNEFQKLINTLHAKKIFKTWNGKHLDLTFEKKENTQKFIGKKSNNDFCKYQLKNIKQNYLSHIKKIDYKNKIWEITLKSNKKLKFRGLILTCPYPQLKKIAKKYLIKKILNLKVKMQPNITVMIALRNRKNLPISSIKFNDDVLAWAANENSKKRFKSNINLWTLQSSIKWANKNINFYKKNNLITKKLYTKFLKITGMMGCKIIDVKTHGWKYSYNFNSTKLKSYWSKNNSLGVCADWFIGPKAENAWQSAVDLSNKIKKNPTIIK